MGFTPRIGSEPEGRVYGTGDDGVAGRRPAHFEMVGDDSDDNIGTP